MSGILSTRIQSIADKASKLVESYNELVDRKREADSLIAQMQATIELQQARIKELQLKVEHLTVVTTLTPGREQVEQTRVVLSELVREIDKCINELNQ